MPSNKDTVFFPVILSDGKWDKIWKKQFSTVLSHDLHRENEKY